MAIEKSKDVTIEGREFRIDLLTAEVGNGILLQIGSKRLAGLTPDDIAFIQKHFFERCWGYKVTSDNKRHAQRIYDGGRWLAPFQDLEYDLVTVNQLFLEAFAFNFDRFFAKREKEREPSPVETADTSL